MATVKECDTASKPVRVAASGHSYIRAWDGDFEMSEVEVRGFHSLRNHPNSDRQPVEGATMSDLDPALVAVWEQTVKEFDPQGLGRFLGEELLVRAGITCDGFGTPSVAGLLALGIHPQQFFPRFVINLSQQPALGSIDSRATNLTTLTGPVPLMLDGALEWARKTFSRSIVTTPEGEVVDQYQYPLDAFRELIGNALAHRDLAPWSQGDATEVRLLPDRLIVTNPGGLYGISVDRLGRPGTTSSRNGRLIEVLKYTRTSSGARVVETLASGIPRVLDAAKAAGMPMPIFQNTDIRFTVLWHAPSVVASPPPAIVTVFLRGSAAEVASQLTSEAQTASDIAFALGLTIPNVRKILRGLIDSQVAVRQGGQGKVTTYRKNASSPPIVAEKPPIRG